MTLVFHVFNSNLFLSLMTCLIESCSYKILVACFIILEFGHLFGLGSFLKKN